MYGEAEREREKERDDATAINGARGIERQTSIQEEEKLQHL